MGLKATIGSSRNVRKRAVPTKVGWTMPFGSNLTSRNHLLYRAKVTIENNMSTITTLDLAMESFTKGTTGYETEKVEPCFYCARTSGNISREGEFQQRRHVYSKCYSCECGRSGPVVDFDMRRPPVNGAMWDACVCAWNRQQRDFAESFEIGRRLFFELHHAKVNPDLQPKTFAVNHDGIKVFVTVALEGTLGLAPRFWKNGE